jgi:hypothetical protein
MTDIATDLQSRVRAAADEGPLNPVRALSRAGIKSEWAYLAGFGSIALSLAAWLASRVNPTDDKAQADRWGIFVGHWAPTFFALGLALKHEERE